MSKQSSELNFFEKCFSVLGLLFAAGIGSAFVYALWTWALTPSVPWAK